MSVIQIILQQLKSNFFSFLYYQVFVIDKVTAVVNIIGGSNFVPC
jgi:hypothetical protein